MITDAEEKGLITPGKVNCSIYYSCINTCWFLKNASMLCVFSSTVFLLLDLDGFVIMILICI
jgi:hypothetical protein